MSYQISSNAASGGAGAPRDLFGGTFTTGNFGTSTDFAGILEKGMVPITIIGLVAVIWLLKKSKK